MNACAIKSESINGASILVVDDSKMNQQVAEAVLTDIGLNVTFADNGMDAVVLLDNNKFDAVHMDIEMPVMNGFETTKIIRLIPGCSDLPIIAVTASEAEKIQEQSNEAGITDYVTRSMNPDALYKVLEKWINPREQ